MHRQFILGLATLLFWPTASLLAADEENWAQFRGPKALGVSKNPDLPDKWSPTKNVLWKRDVAGRGWSSPVIWGNRVFLTTAINEDKTEEPKKGLYFGGNRAAVKTIHRWKVLCLDLNTGEVLWEKLARKGKPQGSIHVKNSYATETPVTDGERVYAYFGNHGLYCYSVEGELLWDKQWPAHKTRYGWGLAASPILHQGKLYLVNDNDEQSYLVALEAKTGKEVWRTNIESDYGGRMMSGWKWSESPLVDGGKVVVTPGGTKGGVLALDAKTGKQVWRCKDFTDSAGYSSLIARDFGGVKQYIQVSGKSVVGVDANSGKLLWQAPRAGKTAVVSNPIFHEGSLFVTSSYGVGCNGFEVSGTGGNFKAKQTYANKSISNHHGGCIRVGDYVYGASGSVLVCLDLKTGKEMWKERSAGKGAIVVVGNKIILRAESKGTISLVELNPNVT